jgi:hypothetical protein
MTGWASPEDVPEAPWRWVALVSAGLWIVAVVGLYAARTLAGLSTNPEWFELGIGPLALVVVGRARGLRGRDWGFASVLMFVIAFGLAFVLVVIRNLVVYGGIND